MAYLSLSRHDTNVLEKIKDPESNPLTAIILDATLPKDPHLTDNSVYEAVIRKEREIVLSMQQIELQFAGIRPRTISEPVTEYHLCLSKLDDLIDKYPNYASARNNRVQALRRLYGDTMLLDSFSDASQSLIPSPNSDEKKKIAIKSLSDLDSCIRLLSPPSLFSAISPQAAKTLSLVYTQRAAIYHMTSKKLQTTPIALGSDRKESSWTKLDFENAASQDFALGGRYGNEIAKGLAVSTNPTAKLCGEMVREAMKKEYGPTFLI
jgi:hypothetical protein